MPSASFYRGHSSTYSPTSQNYQIRAYISPVPEILAWVVDAFSVPRTGLQVYAFVPPVLLTMVLPKDKSTLNLSLLLIVPWWPAWNWFVDLRDLAIHDPLKLAWWPHLLVHPKSVATPSFRQVSSARLVHLHRALGAKLEWRRLLP